MESSPRRIGHRILQVGGHPGQGRESRKALQSINNALDAYELRIHTKDWALAQYNRGRIYLFRVNGDKSENVAQAIYSFRNSLNAFSRDGDPRRHLLVEQALGEELVMQRDWTAASEAYADARATFDLVFGEGLNELEATTLIKNVRSLFVDASYVAAQQGDPGLALEILDQGKARLLAVALKQQFLDLTPEERTRLQALRLETREWIQRATHAEGAEGTAALEKVASLRRELLALVQRTSASQVQESLATALSLDTRSVVVAPVVTKIGAKILVATRSANQLEVSAFEVPDLTTHNLDLLIRGERKDGQIGGWLDAYSIQYLPAFQKALRYREWIAAIESIGPDLWRLFAGTLAKELNGRGIGAGARLIVLPTGALGLLRLDWRKILKRAVALARSIRSLKRQV